MLILNVTWLATHDNQNSRHSLFSKITSKQKLVSNNVTRETYHPPPTDPVFPSLRRSELAGQLHLSFITLTADHLISIVGYVTFNPDFVAGQDLSTLGQDDANLLHNGHSWWNHVVRGHCRSKDCPNKARARYFPLQLYLCCQQMESCSCRSHCKLRLLLSCGRSMEQHYMSPELSKPARIKRFLEMLRKEWGSWMYLEIGAAPAAQPIYGPMRLSI